jgi:hypothetical protein
VDGIRFKIETSSGGGTNTSRVPSTHPDGRLRLHFVTCEFEPCGPHRKEAFADLPGITWSSSQGSPLPWQEYQLGRPVPVHGLRYVFAGPWVWTWSIFDGGPPRANVEVQVILNDGSSLTLDDWASPSPSTYPPEQLIPSSHSLMLDEETQQELDGLWILAFRWRLHACCTLGFSVYPGCPSAVSLCTPAPSPLQLFFLYDFGECRGEPALAALDLSPASGSSFPIGSRVAISGVVPVPDSSVPIAAVLVDGQPVDSLDGSGRFFKVVDVAAGDNLYRIEVVQPGCGQGVTELHLTGVEPDGSAFVNAADVSSEIHATYRNTTFHRTASLLTMDVIACNDGDTSILGPLQMVITRIEDPAVTMARPEGATADGKPFVIVSDFGADNRLAPGECAAPKGSRSHAEPETRARAMARSRRGAVPCRAADPRGVGPTRLRRARGRSGRRRARSSKPAGMTISTTGHVAWTPAAAATGNQTVVVRASGPERRDAELHARRGRQPTNASPLHVGPTTHASVGARYTYDASATRRHARLHPRRRSARAGVDPAGS